MSDAASTVRLPSRKSEIANVVPIEESSVEIAWSAAPTSGSQTIGFGSPGRRARTALAR